MWNKTTGAQILLYGAYVEGVLLALMILMLLFGGSFMGAIMGVKIGFMMALFMALIYLVIGGFMLWVMYSAGKEYLENRTFAQWKAWTVLVLSILGLMGAFRERSFLMMLISIILNGVFAYGAAAMLFAEEE